MDLVDYVPGALSHVYVGAEEQVLVGIRRCG